MVTLLLAEAEKPDKAFEPSEPSEPFDPSATVSHKVQKLMAEAVEKMPYAFMGIAWPLLGKWQKYGGSWMRVIAGEDVANNTKRIALFDETGLSSTRARVILTGISDQAKDVWCNDKQLSSQNAMLWCDGVLTYLGFEFEEDLENDKND